MRALYALALVVLTAPVLYVLYVLRVSVDTGWPFFSGPGDQRVLLFMVSGLLIVVLLLIGVLAIIGWAILVTRCVKRVLR